MDKLTHEVRLRPVEDSDLETLFVHQADPVAARMAVFPSRERTQFEAHWAKIRADPDTLLRVIDADDALAGNIGSWTQDGQRTVGYWIGRDHWGQGIATQALSRFLGEEPVRPLYADVAATNLGSIHVLRKAGFRELQIRTADDGIDELIFIAD